MKKHTYAIFALTTLLILLPHLLRSTAHQPPLAGIESYYHANIAIHIAQGNPTQNATPYHYLLAQAYTLIGTNAFIILPSILALASALLFWLILHNAFPKESQQWILLTYALSPILTTLSMTTTPLSLAIILLFLGIFLAWNNHLALSNIPFLLTLTLGTPYQYATLYTITILYFILKQRTILLIGIPALLSLLLPVPQLPMTPSISHLLSDFGGITGISIFALLLSISALPLLWQYKSTHYNTFALTTGILLFTYHNPHLLFILSIITSILAGTTIAYLANRQWHFLFLKNVTLLSILCGLLFSSIGHAHLLAKEQPTTNFFTTINFSPSIILTHPNYAYWLMYKNHTPVLTPLTEIEQRDDLNVLLKTTDLDLALHLLKKYQIQHIIITSEMRNGLTWDREQQGLDFLVENSEIFKKIHDGEITVWQLQ